MCGYVFVTDFLEWFNEDNINSKFLEWEINENMDSDTACYMFFPTLYMAVVIEEIKENKYLDTGDFF